MRFVIRLTKLTSFKKKLLNSWGMLLAVVLILHMLLLDDQFAIPDIEAMGGVLYGYALQGVPDSSIV